MDEDLVVVYVATNRPVAEMVVDFLSQEGIPAMARAPGLPPFIGVDVAVEILVASDREDEARRAIAAFLEGTPEGWPEEKDDPPKPGGSKRR